MRKYFTKRYWKGQRLLLLAFLLLHTAASFYYIAHQDITFDEPQYIEYAKRWLHGKPERVELLDDSKTPMIAICWLPRMVHQVIDPTYHLDDYGRRDQRAGRYMMIIFSLLAAVYVYKWCRDLYGAAGWQLPLLMLLFDPLYLAYSTLISTDLACGAFLVALLYHFRKYLVTSVRRHFFAAAIFTGLGIVTKQSLLFVLVLLPLLWLLFHWLTTEKKSISRMTFFDPLWFALIILLIINVSYYFYGSFLPFGTYHFESASLQTLQNHLPFLRRLPVPLPLPYVQSIDMLKAHAELGAGHPASTYNGVYLFGQLRMHGSFWYYYLVMLWYKMPLGTLLLLLSCVPLFVRKFRRSSFRQHYLFLLVPIIFYWIILSFFNQFQTGIRHLLPVFPLIYIGLGKLWYEVAKASKKVQVLATAAVVCTFFSVGVYYPFLIPYTNEFIHDKKLVYKKIMDSGIDYGQADHHIADFIQEHPGYKAASAVPDTGRFAIVMANVINNDRREKNPYQWYQKLQPEGLYEYVVLLYTVTEEDLLKAGLWKK